MPETATALLHRLTSYDGRRDWAEAPIDHPGVVQDFEPNDVSRLPWFYKRYPDELPRVALPHALPPTSAPAIDVLAGLADVSSRGVDLADLARLLHLSAGVVRTTQRAYGTFLFRAAGSAGGRFPLELYVAIPAGHGLPAGVHWYHPEDHALVTVARPPEGDSPAVLVTGIPWRTAWRYRERGFRHVYWDAGTMLAQLLALADSAGLPALLHTRFVDSVITELVGADGVHEWPVAVVALGDGPALVPTGRAETGQVDSDPLELPLVTAAQRAGERSAPGRGWGRGAPAGVQVHATSPLEVVVLARGSQRRMDRTRGLRQEVLQTCMTVSLREITVPHRVVVHDVDGLEPGVYRWPDLSSPARSGLLRDELYRVCLEQELASDAAFVVIAGTDVSKLDDREYREAHLAAGLVAGRLHLAAYALGASASGMTFIDSAVPALLGEELDGLLFTCVGVPEYASAAGGMPGEPTEVRTVEPRVGP
jgi:nitroreductase